MATDISIRNNLDTQIGVLYGYFNDSIDVYLEGKVSILTLSVLDENNYRELLEKGNSLSFSHEDEDYHMTIIKKEEDEDTITVTAWSLVMELNNETKKPFEGTSLTFEQYLKAFDGERILTLGINEVSDKKISYKWESQTNMLERLYSLAKVFNSEIEFVSVLDDDGSLKQLIVNVYKEHDTSNQGMGQDKSNQVFYFGDTISTVRKTSDIVNLYTAIRPTGKDGLTLNSYNMSEVKDEDGKVLYYLRNGMLYAPQAREQFRSNLINKADGWTVYDWETEYTTQAALCGNTLTKLKELSSPATTWTIEGYIKAKIGDTISIQDDGYNPTLLLTARIIAQKICMTDPSSNETTFSNVIEQKSEISADLVAKMNELIAEKVVYASSLITTNGISFKNGEGSTTLKAKVFSGSAEVTKDVTVRWYKNDAFVATAYELEVKASDIEEKAVYRFEVIDTFGITRATSEVTIFNVSDGSNGVNGQTSYFHTAWANSADGKADFSLTNSTNKLYIGVYSDFSIAGSTDPTKYKWTLIKGEKGDQGIQGLQGEDGKQGIPGVKGENGITYYTHIAYANSADGKTDFSTSNPDRIYIGMYVDEVKNDSTDPTKYAWTLVKGAKGDQGIAGTPGVNGKTPYFHTAWANSADGKVDFSTTVSLNKKYLGTYTDFTQADSTDPTKYNWTETGNAIDLHFAYSWSENGTDRFTKPYPTKNILRNSKLRPVEGTPTSIEGWGRSTLTVTTGDEYLTIEKTETQSSRAFFSQALLASDIKVNSEYSTMLDVYIESVTGANSGGSNVFLRTSTSSGAYADAPRANLDITKVGMWQRLVATGTTYSSDFNTAQYTLALSGDLIIKLRIKNPKLSEGTTAIPYTPSPDEDFVNAYPVYRGSSTKDSDDPNDYNWALDPNWIQLNTDKSLSDKVGSDELNQVWEEIGNRVTQEEADGIRELAQSVSDSYNTFVNSGGQYQNDLEALESRTSALVQSLGDQLATYEFLQTYIKLGEEGISIGSEDSTMKVLISKDKLSFTDGGQTVAYFSNQAFFINRGAIVDSLQVGQHKMVRLNSEHTIFQYIQ